LKAGGVAAAILMGVLLLPFSVPGEEASRIFAESLPMEVRASSYQELADWCRRLGLSSQGSRSDLEKRLYDHYGLAEPAAPGRDETLIRIDSADSTEYFSLRQFGEDYVRLAGGVRISLQDGRKGHTYTIRADRVLFNQTLKLLSAVGGVEYRIAGAGRDEVFFGESLTLNTETWEGYFFDGASFRDRTVDSQTLRFRFQGEFISRGPQDFVIMEDAWISSSPGIPANYRIRAEKVWIMGPGEWGIRNASLYVGHIPVFYFPFFYYPGDEVIFHPVFGYRSREGAFVQTTTYFLGNRKNDELPLSFLQLTEGEKNDRVKERHGIFLRDTPEKLSHPDRYVKGLFDLYSRLGVYAGVSGSLPGIASFANTLTFHGGIGVSRTLYYGQSGLGSEYSPYWSGSDGLRDHWNSTRIGRLDLPFRFGGEAKLSGTLGGWKANVSMETYSDPYVTQDFLDRKEQIDWSRLMEGVLEDTPTVILKDRLTWRVDSSYLPQLRELPPLLSSFSLSRLLVSFDWRSREIPRFDPQNPMVQLLPDHAVADPTRRFFYPDTATLPELSLQIGGTLLSSDRRPSRVPSGQPPGKPPSEGPIPGETAPGGKPPGDGLRPPWEDREETVGKEPPDEHRLPPPRGDLPLPAPPEPLRYTVSYQLRPRTHYQLKTDSQNWVLPDDIRYEAASATLTFDNTAQILYDLQVYGPLLQTRGSLGLTTQYQTVDYKTDTLSAAEKSSLDLQAYRYRTQNLAQNLDITSHPLSSTDMFKSANLRYLIQTSLYKKSFDHLAGSEPVYREEFATFSRNMVTAHRVSLDIAAETLPVTPKIQMAYVCPPLDEVFSLSGGLITGPLSSMVTYQTRNEVGRWRSQPLSVDEQLKIGDSLEFRAVYLHDFNEGVPYSLVTTTRLGPIGAGFQARYTEPYTYAGGGGGWIRDTEKAFIPSSAWMSVKYSLKPEPLWKNRLLLSGDIKGDWKMDLIQYTESELVFGVGFTFSLHRFLDLRLSSQSKNTMMYQYFPGYARGVGREWRNPLTDLLRSFNFFKTDDRYASHFKLSTISFEAVHHLDDWDLSLTYSGKPELVTDTGGRKNFIWKSELGIALRWKPIPQIKSEFRVD